MAKRSTVFITTQISRPLKSALVAYSEATGLKLKAAIGKLLVDGLAARGVTVDPPAHASMNSGKSISCDAEYKARQE